MSTSLSLTGTVTQIGAVEQVSDKLRKCIFAITTDGEYPKSVAFEAINDKCELVSKLSYDDVVEVFFNLESREWNGKWFTSAKPWKIEILSADSTKGAVPSQELPSNHSEDDGDLPF